MKIKKEVTDAVIAANRRNSQKSTGPRTEWGKTVVSRNAEKHWIYAKNLGFKNEDEETAYKLIFKKLRRSLKTDDTPAVIVAELLATEYIRYGRSLRLDQRIFKSRSPGNQALQAVRDSDLLDLPWLGSEDSNGWQCQEVSLRAKEGKEFQNKNGAVAAGSGDDRHVELHAKFANPAEAVLRCQGAAERRLYRALRNYEKAQKQNGRDNEKQ